MKRVILAGAILALAAAAARGQSVPQMVNYQGKLTDVDGVPLSTGTYTLEFNIYADAETTESLIWGPLKFDGASNPQVVVIGGHFNVFLGPEDEEGDPIADAFTAPERYLGIRLTSGTEVIDILPRQRLLSSPYAIQAKNANRAEGADLADWATTATKALDAISAQDADEAAHALLADQATHATDADTLAGGKLQGSPEGLLAQGIVKATGGFRFPDETLMTRAAYNGKNVIIVDKGGGGQFTSVTTALLSITDSSAKNPYLVWVAPGRYSEPGFVVPRGVHLMGAGQKSTFITQEPTCNVTPYADSTISNLTVRREAAPLDGAVIFYLADAFEVYIHDVTVDCRTVTHANQIAFGFYGYCGIRLERVTTTECGIDLWFYGTPGCSVSCTDCNFYSLGSNIYLYRAPGTPGTNFTVGLTRCQLQTDASTWLYAEPNITASYVTLSPDCSLPPNTTVNAGSGVTVAQQLGPNSLLVPRGASIQNAFNTITDASATNRWTVHLAPGQHVLASPITCIDYVSLTGAGERSTFLTMKGNVPIDLADSMTIENLTIFYEGISDQEGAVFEISRSNKKVAIRNVRIDAPKPETNPSWRALYLKSPISNSKVRMENVRARNLMCLVVISADTAYNEVDLWHCVAKDMRGVPLFTYGLSGRINARYCALDPESGGNYALARGGTIHVFGGITTTSSHEGTVTAPGGWPSEVDDSDIVYDE